MTAGDELKAARADVLELNRQLARSEKRQREMASMLDGMGFSFKKSLSHCDGPYHSRDFERRGVRMAATAEQTAR